MALLVAAARDAAPRGLVRLLSRALAIALGWAGMRLLFGRPACRRHRRMGEVLLAMGYAVLAIDHWCFGERNRHSERDGQTPAGQTGRSIIAHDSLTALDWALA